MTEKLLWPLFSKPILKTFVNLREIDLSNIKWARNYQNYISISQQILDEPEFAALKEQVLINLAEYFYGIMQAKHDIGIYITESWLNKTEQGQSHHRHWHPNSILSGVVYLQTDGDSGKIKFITSQFDTIEYGINDANIYNSRSWSVVPETESMIIFPSNVEHLVEEYTGNIPRISLAFNTFLRGNVNTDPLTRLII